MNPIFGINSHEFGANIAALNFISQQQRTVQNVLLPFMHIMKVLTVTQAPQRATS